MDVKTFSDQLRSRMNEQIEATRNEETDDLATTAKIIQVIRDSLFELKQFIHLYEFKEQEEEVCFFKEIKPGFQSKYFFHQWVFDKEIETSFLDYEKANKFYEEQLSQIRAFRARNRELYLYFKSGRKHHDHQYFVRRNSQFNLYPDVDCSFSTGYDNKVARIIAYDLLEEFLQKKRNKIPGQSEHENGISKFHWTATKTDLVELIYALHAQ
ncbi:MAG: RteC domain-containing protein, partial [Cytophagales bacterium]|nr:RteC domain-containing protein [Cytophagales bacterium]